MRILLLLLLFLSSNAFSQVRVAIDVSTKGNQLVPDFLFCKVFRYKYYLKTGFSAGTFSTGEKEGKVIGIGEGWMNNDYEPIVSAYNDMNFPEDTMAKLVYYKERNRGFSIEGGVGRFTEFNDVHTLRFDLQLKGYFFHSEIIGDYDPLHNSSKDYSAVYNVWHYALSIGPEIFHAIRFSPRLTGYYGVKMPLYIPFETRHYSLLPGSSPVRGLKVYLSVGMSCALGKKTKE